MDKLCVPRILAGFAAAGLFFSGGAPAWADGDPSLKTQPVYEDRTGQWSARGGIGFLSDTPDGTGFAVNGGADYFVDQNWSVGPLMQFLLNDAFQVGISAQGKYWVDFPGDEGRTKAFFEAGLGFVHTDYFLDDTSWLVPLGIGIDHLLDGGVSLYGEFILNFTDLDAGPGAKADVMPGLTFGVRF